MDALELMVARREFFIERAAYWWSRGKEKTAHRYELLGAGVSVAIYDVAYLYGEM